MNIPFPWIPHGVKHVQTPRYREAAEAYLDLTIGKADGPWWAMGLNKNDDFGCRFFLGDWLFVNPNISFW